MNKIQKQESPFKLATRTNWKFTPNELTLRLKALEASGASILDLSESNPTRCKFEYLNHQLLAPFSNSENLRYDPASKGLSEARSTIQNYYSEKNVKVDSERIFLTASTSEAYSFLFRLLLNPGERVLIPRPSYPLLDFLADLNDIRLDSYDLDYDEDGWHIDTESLIDACGSETKLVVLIHPNNPTGSFVKQKELNKLLELAQEKSIALISDEVFSDYSFFDDSERAPSLAANEEVLTFTLNGISKILGLPQMKLAWIIANGPKNSLGSVLQRLEIISDTYLSVNTPVQKALPSWLSMKKANQDEIMMRIRNNYAFLGGLLANPHPASCLKTEGGWYAMLKLPKIQNAEEWALEFLDQDRVYLYPGYFFDFRDEAYVILSLLPPPDIFNEGVSRILARIKNKC